MTGTTRGCRACGATAAARILDLGAVPAADHFPAQDDPVTDKTYALAMDLCGACGLAQLADDDTIADEPRGVEPQALRDQAADAVARVAADGWLRGGTVREFGSPHGGTWIPLLTERGYRETPDTAADVVLDSFGMMHEPDQAAAVAARAAATRPGGVLLLQFHSLRAIVTQGQWNALRHGHFAYYTLPVLQRMLAGAGMRPVRAWEFDLYGGTILVAAVPEAVPAHPAIGRLLALEQPFTTVAGTAALQFEADRQARELRAWLTSAAARGQRICAYGAASRAVALFARAGLDRGLLAGVADASPEKHGRRMPGTDIPIITPKQLLDNDPDAVLLTVPDLLAEVRAAYPALNGKWTAEFRFPQQ